MTGVPPLDGNDQACEGRWEWCCSWCGGQQSTEADCGRGRVIPSSDLVKRLRDRATWEDEEGAYPEYSDLLREAADELERLKR